MYLRFCYGYSNGSIFLSQLTDQFDKASIINFAKKKVYKYNKTWFKNENRLEIKVTYSKQKGSSQQQFRRARMGLDRPPLLNTPYLIIIFCNFLQKQTSKLLCFSILGAASNQSTQKRLQLDHGLWCTLIIVIWKCCRLPSGWARNFGQ